MPKKRRRLRHNHLNSFRLVHHLHKLRRRQLPAQLPSRYPNRRFHDQRFLKHHQFNTRTWHLPPHHSLAARSSLHTTFQWYLHKDLALRECGHQRLRDRSHSHSNKSRPNLLHKDQSPTLRFLLRISILQCRRRLLAHRWLRLRANSIRSGNTRLPRHSSLRL